MAKTYKALMLPIEIHYLIKETAKKSDDISMIELIKYLIEKEYVESLKKPLPSNNL